MKTELLSHTPSKQLINSLPTSEVPEREFMSHLGFTFAIEGISRACSHQLVRHRVASFSQQSQRYIQAKRLLERVVVPPSIEEKAGDEFNEFIQEASNTYNKFIELGVPREDARFILPNAVATSLLITMDGRSLMHFFGLRLCERAQWEVRAIAEDMLAQVRAVEPELFSNAGPYCVQLGRCPEGKFSCGKMEEMRKLYGLS